MRGESGFGGNTLQFVILTVYTVLVNVSTVINCSLHSQWNLTLLQLLTPNKVKNPPSFSVRPVLVVQS